MNDIDTKGARQSDSSETPPPQTPSFPSKGATLSQSIAGFASFLVKHFWWIVLAAAILKVLCYVIAPRGNCTAGGHFGEILKGFISYGGILAIVAFILSKCIKKRHNVFKISFAALFALACLLDLPTAIMRAKVVAFADHINDSYLAFEALMPYESGHVEWLQQKMIRQDRKPDDGEKYYMLSFFYATGSNGQQKDIGKAVQLCQMAATEGDTYAQFLLRKVGLSWQKKKR